MRDLWVTLALLAQRFFRAEAYQWDDVLFEHIGIEQRYHSVIIVSEPSACLMVKHRLIGRVDQYPMKPAHSP